MRIVSLIAAVMLLAFAGAASAQPYPGPPPYHPGHHGGEIVSCGSPQYRLAHCPVPGAWRGVRLVRQTSKSACVQGRTWGFDRGGIWVNQGCSADFAVGGYAGAWQPNPGWNHDFVMSCGSPQHRYNFCQVDVGGHGHVMVRRRLSSAACIEGRTWGWNRGGIWVNQGCSAQFTVARRW